MTSSVTGFDFTNDRPAAAEGRQIVRIPAGINRKGRLLAEYARQLCFPGYFGWNWDAFEECLRDLGWLTGVKDVVIVHRDVPFANSPEQQQIYLSILHDLVTNSADPAPRVQAIFPRRNEQAVILALNR